MKLLEKFVLGKLELKNRIAMAPMTRSRADLELVQNDMAPEYYAQRASAGLIISEGVNIARNGAGYIFTPGIYNQKQIDSWKKVTEKVHEKGGVIFLQLWHTGRIGHSANLEGNLPLAPSAIAAKAQVFTMEGQKDTETPKELSKEEIKEIIEQYRQGAINAIEAGFDGVEIHGAFGYLPDQFQTDGANQRTDEYGGSVENRSRFNLEVLQAVSEAVGSHRVGIKLSPSNTFNGVSDSNPKAWFKYLLEKLNDMDLAYIQVMEAMLPAEALPSNYITGVAKFAREIYKGTIIANAGYSAESAEAILQSGDADMVSFGQLFLANPDLPKRFELKSELNTPNHATFYGGGAEGYIDYPFL
jgi:N-ethylmaleimide reductase